MGVHGLWELLSPVGHRVSNEHVRNKILAVDISIWLTQFVKAMRDAEGAQVRNAHLLGVLRRCIKLLYLSVRPVLVFDGATPGLKRRTLAGRRSMRDRHEAKLRRLAERMLVNRMKISVLGAAIQTKRKGFKTKGNGRSTKSKQLTNPARNIHQAHGEAAEASDEGTRTQKSQEETEEEEEDCVQPVYGTNPVRARTPNDEKTIPPEVIRIQEEEDAIFAADLADEEEAMTRERDAAPIDMPYDVDDIDDGTLQDLPPTMQSEIFKQIKFNQRARHRERMLLQKNDPTQFSRAQIEGFLQNTALNRKIRNARSVLNDKSGASNRIASDSKRQYVLEDKNERSLSSEGSFSNDHSSDDSSDDDFSAAGLEPRKGIMRKAAPDILAQLRAKRDAKLGVSSAMREERNQIRRENDQKRSGVGWASRVLEGKGSLVLGGRSALGASSREATKVMSESDCESWDDARSSENMQANGTKDTASALVESDDDDSDEWEDGDAASLPNDSEEAPDFGFPGCKRNLFKTTDGGVEHSSRHEIVERQLVNASVKKEVEGETKKQASQGNCESRSGDVNEISEEGRVEEPEVSVPKRRCELFDLDATSDGDSDVWEELILESRHGPTPDENSILEKGEQGNSLAGRCKTQTNDVGGMSKQDNVKKPNFCGQKRRIGLLDLNAAGNEDFENLEDPIAEGPLPAHQNTQTSLITNLSEDRTASGGPAPSTSFAERPNDDNLKSGQSGNKFLALGLNEGAVRGNLSHSPQTGLQTIQDCGYPVAEGPQGQDRRNQMKQSTEAPSLAVEQELRKQVSNASKRVTFHEVDVSKQPRPAVESMTGLKSAPDLNTVDGDMSSARDVPDNHAKNITHKRKADAEEQEDLQLAVALSLQEGKSQERDAEEQKDLQLAVALSLKEGKSQETPTLREGKARILEQETAHLGMHQGTEKEIFERDRSMSSDRVFGLGQAGGGKAAEPKTTDEMQIEAKINSRNDHTLDDVKKYDYLENVTQAAEPQSDGHPDKIVAVQSEEAKHFEATELSTERMQELRDELEIEGRELQRQKTSHQGGAESVSEEMYGEARDLLKLFGIPYLEAPEEAEAQCAFLNMEGVVDGVITEDSDAFLFGAQTVYRKLFSEGQFAEAYEARHICSKLGLDRDLLIRLAYLLGSDYTVGVRGVGVVNSMEILEAFPGENGLQEFRDWTKKVTVFDEQPEEEVMTGKSREAIRRRFCWKHRNMKRNWEVRPEFPNKAVAEAYLRPRINPSTERFRWGRVDFTGLRSFCWEKFGWEEDRFELAVGPLRQKLKSDRAEKGQTRIDEFFKPHRFAKIRSVRLQTAVTGMVGAEAEDLMADTLGRPKVKRRKTAAVANIAVDSDEEKEMMAAAEKAERKLGERKGKAG
eukprot:GFKZ01012544.1.p1 GENE.GFKZ01012544.1~~GFKZ01012544.1.p1  ORF type:complete len:1385 (-),score=255.17 GFKZ01012544.1:1795-5949(-)